MGHYACDMRPEWFEKPKPKAKPVAGDSPVDGAKVSEPVEPAEPTEKVTLAKELEKLEATVDNFASRMKSRLYQKAKQGFAGWDTAAPDVLRELLLSSIYKESTLDLGIYAMMLAHRGISMKSSSNEN